MVGEIENEKWDVYMTSAVVKANGGTMEVLVQNVVRENVRRPDGSSVTTWVAYTDKGRLVLNKTNQKLLANLGFEPKTLIGKKLQLGVVQVNFAGTLRDSIIIQKVY